MGERLTADTIVVGAGPAGSTLAARLAQLGLEVVLVERVAFPRRRLGESLTPGVLPLLSLTGARATVEAAGFPAVGTVVVDWDGGPRERPADDRPGLLVDRGHFDRLLLDHARSLGVRVLQPAVVSERRRDGEGWVLSVDAPGGTVSIAGSFLALAGGRGGPGRRALTGPRTVALYAYWHGARSRRPRIEALADAWCWTVPLPDGSTNALLFVDRERLRAEGSAEACYHALLRRSAAWPDLAEARVAGRVRAADATPFLDAEAVGDASIRVGDAALAVDPISSSGVQRAVQTALAGAVVVNTLLRRPAAADAAQRYYRDSLGRAAERHRRWAAEHYATAAATRRSRFWTARAGDASSQPAAPPAPGRPLDGGIPLELSPDAAFVELPCVAGEFVEVRTGVAHPRLEEPVAYIGGWELAPLLRRLPPGATARELARTWSAVVPESTGVAIGDWLTSRGILVAAGAQP